MAYLRGMVIFGAYVLCEVRGESNFVIGDAYPIATCASDEDGGNSICRFFPISPKRMIIIASKGYEGFPSKYFVIDKKIFQVPNYDKNKNIVIKVKKIYENDVNELNSQMKKSSKYGYVYYGQNNNIK